jgi:hypothetical protein
VLAENGIDPVGRRFGLQGSFAGRPRETARNSRSDSRPGSSKPGDADYMAVWIVPSRSLEIRESTVKPNFGLRRLRTESLRCTPSCWPD